MIDEVAFPYAFLLNLGIRGIKSPLIVLWLFGAAVSERSFMSY